MQKLFENFRKFSTEDNNIRIAAVGDSLTVAGNTYIKMLDGKHYGQGGQPSWRLGKHLDRALRTKPDYLIIFMGTNDVGWRGGCSDWHIKLKSILGSMYERVKVESPKTKIIGMTLLSGGVKKPSRWADRWARCPKKPVHCCKQKHPDILLRKTIEVNDFILNYPGVIGIDNSDMWDEYGILSAKGSKYVKGHREGGDRIHLSSAGQAHLANKIEAIIGRN